MKVKRSKIRTIAIILADAEIIFLIIFCIFICWKVVNRTGGNL
jgi:hypothetical protein